MNMTSINEEAKMNGNIATTFVRKGIRPLFALAVLASLTIFSVHAATTGTLKFEGVIMPGTCNLDPGDISRTITLDPVSIAVFVDQVSVGTKEFQLTARCDLGVGNVTFAFSGTPDTTDKWRFQNTGTAGGIALNLSSNGTTIRADGTDSARTVTTSNGVASLPLEASYWKAGAVKSGTLVSQVTVNITYQ
ncbi:fimbrial protein [Pseudomonas sp. KCJK9016]|uniref:fimbrial protein n=1 Tax=Pseudomonas sp. KCJK9016 TaxID=3344556 RepID=UPI0039062D9E